MRKPKHAYTSKWLKVSLMGLIILFLSHEFHSQILIEKRIIGSFYSDTSNYYDNDLLSPEFHKQRRQELRKLLPDKSMAVVFANPIRNRSNDVDYEYHQNPDFYYFTGIKEPNCMVLIFKDMQELDSIHTDEILFIPNRNASFELWNGKRLGPEESKRKMKISEAFSSESFVSFNLNFSNYDHVLFIDPGEDIRDDKREKGDLASLRGHLYQKLDTLYKAEDQNLMKSLVSTLRQNKQPEELKLMRKAINITCEAQKELMRAMIPGMSEYESEAIVEYVFKASGAEHSGFPSIIGGGPNSCVLHYIHNRKTLLWEDLLVSDIGAEYHGYTADVSRTIPVDGHFSDEEKAIYNLVLKAQEAAIELCTAGMKFRDPHNKAKEIIANGLVELGIIDEPAKVGRYFMHGTSHYLGLDVHDVGLYEPFKLMEVITVEPGIYIPANSLCDKKWWNIGVRIEDDILITDSEPEVLSSCVPKKVEDVEALMKEESLFNVIGK